MKFMGEIVKIELTPEGRLRLDYELREGMAKAGYKGPGLYDILDLGFTLDRKWPLEGEILLSQLVVLAAKLKMQITIGDINLMPMPKT
jgi:hypothetical protein